MRFIDKVKGFIIPSLFVAVVCFAIIGCIRDSKDISTPAQLPNKISLATASVDGYDITFSPASADQSIQAGEVVTITATPSVTDADNDFSFTGFTFSPYADGLTDTNPDPLVFCFTVPDYPAKGQIIVFTPTTTPKTKYILSLGNLPSNLSVTFATDPAIATTEGVIATRVVKLTASDVAGYEFVGWQHSGAVTLFNGDWTTPTINVYVTGAGASVVAEYNFAYVVCPAGDVTVATPEGTLTWAGSNLANVGVFARHSYDFGCLFQWGYKYGADNATVIAGAPVSGSNQSTNMRATAQSAETWPEGEDPCPAGWRLPTALELRWLTNRTDAMEGTGAADGTYTSVSWTRGTGATNGLKVVTKAVNGVEADRVLQFPNASSRVANGYNSGAGTSGIYWLGENQYSATNGYHLQFAVNTEAGNLSDSSKLSAYPVRCVR